MFDPMRCQKELDQFRQWLEKHPNLEERADILPFFRRRKQLSLFIGSYSRNIHNPDRLAFEYPLFGDLTCDLAVGDSERNSFLFLEFEDGGPASLFVQEGKKTMRRWSPRLERGFGQILDWFHKLEDMKWTDDFITRFGARTISVEGILVIGRDRYLKSGEKERLKWRRQNVVVASQHIQCVTFDRLLLDLQGRLRTFLVGKSVGS